MCAEVLDPCCGSKMFWFQKEHENVVYGDCRYEGFVLCDGRALNITPDIVVDFRDMPFDDNSFNLVVFDPPHLRWAGEKSWMKKKYGTLDKNTWPEDLRAGFNECWRVLSPGGTLIFKWAETQIKIKRVLNCFSQKPLFGHTTTKNLKTHWMVFYKEMINNECNI